MQITSSRILILAALVALVAIVLPGAWEYLTVRACLESGILTSSGSFCPQGDERLPLMAVQWVQVPTVASTVTALFAAIVVSLGFTFHDHRTRRRVAD
jgi:hypothetical protein